jgi:DNA polymerase-3 subunit alpha
MLYQKKIKKIQTYKQKQVFDIHHKISSKEFYDNHPNLIVNNGFVISNCSRHAGGIVITDNSFENMPLIKAKGGLQTPWPEGLNGRYLEDFGFLKFDILGLGTLRMFEECIRKILIKQGNKNPTFQNVRDWYDANLDSQNNNFDDINVYKHVFWEGNYHSIFQFVRPNTQAFMKQMKPKSIKDISVATSIFRPGPLSLGVDKQYLENRNNPSKVIYKHPILEEVFKDTCGLLIFQEQLQFIYNKMAGVPLEDTDGVRKAFTKKDIQNKEKAAFERQKLKEDFIKLCKDKNNIAENITSPLFDEMERLVAYSFNLAHAISYAITTYQCCYLLYYYPDEWITTAIDYAAMDKGKANGQEDPKAIALSEARQLGYEISKPDINKSELGYIIDPDRPKHIIPGMGGLKYVGKSAYWEIKNNRSYKYLIDLFIKQGNWKHSKFNKRALSTLIKLEAFESMGLVGPGKLFANYKNMHNVLVDNYDKLKRISNKKKDNDITGELSKLCLEQNPNDDWTREEKIDFQLNLQGHVDFSLILPKEKLLKLKELKIPCIDQYDFEQQELDPKYKQDCWAIIKKAQIKTTKTGKPYLYLKLGGESGKEYTCMIWNWKNDISKLTINGIVAGIFSYDGAFGAFKCWPNDLYVV